jgi:elongation factor G
MDRSGADFFNVVNDVKEKLGANPFPFRYQLVQKSAFKEWLTLITNQAIVWNEDDMGMTFEVIPIPEDLQDTVMNIVRNCSKQLLNMTKSLGEILRRSRQHFTLKKFVQPIRAAVIDMSIIPYDVWFCL